MLARTAPNWDKDRLLLAMGIGLIITMTGLVLIFANAPVGYDVRYGLSQASPRLFNWVPHLDLTPQLYTGLGLFFFVSSWILYFGAVRTAFRSADGEWTRKMTFIVGTILCLIVLFLLPPVLSGDIYEYAFRGRIATVYGQNPYIAPPSEFPADPLYSRVVWVDEVSRYGPVWMVISVIISWAGGESPVLLGILFKLVGAVAVQIAAWSAMQLASASKAGGAAYVAVSWSPIVLVESVGSAHPDVFMIALALWGMVMLQRDKRCIGLFLIILSIFTKYLSALLLVLLLVWCYGPAFMEKHWPKRVLGVVLIAGLGILGLLTGCGRMNLMALVGHPEVNHCVTVARHVLDQLVRIGLSFFHIPFDQHSAALTGFWVLHTGFAVALLALCSSYLRRQRSIRAVVANFGWLSLVYILIIYGGGFPWYMMTPIIAGAAAMALSNHRLWLWCSAVGLAEMALYLFLVPV